MSKKLTDREAWNLVMTKGKKLEKRIIHGLGANEVISIIATADFFGPCDQFLSQIKFDLLTAQYKIYDWIAMLLNGRHKGYKNEYLPTHKLITRVMTDAYLREEVQSVKDFVEVMRTVDYDIVAPVEIEWTSWSGY